MATSSFCGRIVKNIVLDITGVLKDGGQAITGSVDAIEKLYKSGLQVRFCTNETTMTRDSLVQQLKGLGFNLIEKHVFPPVPAMCKVLSERNLRPHLLVHPDSLPDFKDVDCSNPNCVIIGDATEQFSYDNLNKAFQTLMQMDTPILFSLGRGKYYQEKGELVLDVGAYMAALEYATGTTAEIVGKPSSTFFGAVLQDMGAAASETVMVGDDIVNDVGGAQACGMTGVLVRTGKFRPKDEDHPSVKPDAIVDNLAEFVNHILANMS